MRFRLYSFLVLFFLLTQAMGIIVASDFLSQDITVSIINENKEDPVNAIALIVWILAFTGFFLFLMKFFKSHKGLLFRIMEGLAVFATTALVVDVFFPGIGTMFGLLLVMERMAARENIWLKNAASVFAVTGAGSLIGISLGVFPVLVFICLLAVYDLIAVFKTKHMVKMAKAIVSENLAFTFTIPTKEHSFQLGTGDLVIPLVFVVAVFSAAGLPFSAAVIPVAMIGSGSVLGLIGTLHICAEKKIALPALPLQTAYMAIAWLFSFFIGIPVL